mmetsp:Transcript_21594/g.68417  ORF Transcript_21594/g.68417 Transcript_21594/m.68417 type:complete len:207 (+) Transcript_21594:1363-1983(+)
MEDTPRAHLHQRSRGRHRHRLPARLSALHEPRRRRPSRPRVPELHAVQRLCVPAGLQEVAGAAVLRFLRPGAVPPPSPREACSGSAPRPPRAEASHRAAHLLAPAGGAGPDAAEPRAVRRGAPGSLRAACRGAAAARRARLPSNLEQAGLCAPSPHRRRLRCRRLFRGRRARHRAGARPHLRRSDGKPAQPREDPDTPRIAACTRR